MVCHTITCNKSEKNNFKKLSTQHQGLLCRCQACLLGNKTYTSTNGVTTFRGGLANSTSPGTLK